MLAKQYVYFAVTSRFSNEEVANYLGLLTPDEIVDVPSMWPSGPLSCPRTEWRFTEDRTFYWTGGEDDPTYWISSQINRLMDRLAPAQEDFVSLAIERDVARGDVMKLVVVTQVNDPDALDSYGGWSLEPDTLQFLAAVGASVEVEIHGLD